MTDELRTELHEQLSAADSEIGALFARVTLGITAATNTLLAGDLKAVDQLVEGDRSADKVTTVLEEELQRCMAREAPVASDLRFVLTALRVAPQLERCTDLVSHIAQRAPLGPRLPDEVRGLFRTAGRMAGSMWVAASAAWDERDPGAADAIDESDDELDLLIDGLPRLVAGSMSDPVMAMECTLLGRFYERLGDHAVHLAQRVTWMATGT